VICKMQWWVLEKCWFSFCKTQSIVYMYFKTKLHPIKKRH
jgi:hypothetical protein